MSVWTAVLVGKGNDTDPDLPPGTPPRRNFEGPWFSTQLALSLAIGISSFLLFCFLRTRWPVAYMPRTRLKDFSPALAHTSDVLKAQGNRFFGWIMPTLKTSDFVVLQTVGLDASVLLSFFRMSFVFFSLLAGLAAIVTLILLPFESWLGKVGPDPKEVITNGTHVATLEIPWAGINSTLPQTLFDALVDPVMPAGLQLIATWTITLILLGFLHRYFHRFVAARQSFALQLIHSVPSRTVLVTDIPPQYRGDRALAEYFEGCGWEVESVSICRHLSALKEALRRRTDALLELERAWARWVGNPADAPGYDSEVYRKQKGGIEDGPRLLSQLNEGTLVETDDSHNNAGNNAGDENVDTSDLPDDPESLRLRYAGVKSTKPRPTVRPSVISRAVDAIQYWEDRFWAADEGVRLLRKTGLFPATDVAFVTFEHAKSAQEAAQVVHFNEHSQMVTSLAPEPRDVLWSTVAMPSRERHIRSAAVMVIMVLLLLFWAIPVSFFGAFLSDKEIKKVAPWLWRFMKNNPRAGAFIQNTGPTLILISFNSLLPFFLEWLCYQQGFKSKSAVEYSLTRKYYLYLLMTVLFIFLITTTYWQFVRDLADNPSKIAEKLAIALRTSKARYFMISYVMLYGLGLMPLSILNIGPLFNLAWGYIRSPSGHFGSKTPRDYAEINAPPSINYGWVYPQMLLIFTVTLVYSIVSPLILVFGAIFFGMAYLVYKYKLLFIYFKPYESNGEAWRITFDRILVALIIFQLFMTGLLSLSKHFWYVACMVPLIAYTLFWGYVMSRDFEPLSKYTALSSICEVERGESIDEVTGFYPEGEGAAAHHGTLTGLNHRRYAVNDDTMWVAPADKRTDYSQPPMGNFYYGVLNTGKRRYAHPALSGKLPKPWLPSKARPAAFGDSAAQRRGIVLSFRRKVAQRLRRQGGGPETLPDDSGRASSSTSVPTDWLTGGPVEGSSSDQGSRQRRDESSLNVNSHPAYASDYSSTPSNPWRDPTPEPHQEPQIPRRLSFDTGTGIIALPDEHIWDDMEDDNDDDDDHTPLGEDEQPPASPSTYFHRPNRRRTISGGTGARDASPTV